MILNIHSRLKSRKAEPWSEETWTKVKGWLTSYYKYILSYPKGEAIPADEELSIPQVILNYLKSVQYARTTEGKKLILFVGKSASGKSTLTLFCGGYPLKVDQEKAMDSLCVDESLAKELPRTGITMGAGAHSCTDTIHTLPILEADQNDFMLCDTAGFGDTRGLNIEISNIFSFIEAVHGARSVKIVMVIGWSSAGRLESIRDTEKIVKKMIPAIETNTEELHLIYTKFSFIFSQVSKGKADQIISWINDLKTKKEEVHSQENEVVQELEIVSEEETEEKDEDDFVYIKPTVVASGKNEKISPREMTDEIYNQLLNAPHNEVNPQFIVVNNPFIGAVESVKKKQKVSHYPLSVDLLQPMDRKKILQCTLLFPTTPMF